MDLPFLAGLHDRGVFFVLRPKCNMLFETVKKLHCKGKALQDELVHPVGVKPAKAYRQPIDPHRPSRKIPCKCRRKAWYYVARVLPMGCQ